VVLAPTPLVVLFLQFLRVGVRVILLRAVSGQRWAVGVLTAARSVIG